MSEVRRVSAEDVRPLRHLVLRPGRPFEETAFPGDDAPSAVHFGAFRNHELLAVATLLDSPHPERAGRACQVRGMASHPNVRGAGYGAAALAACVAEARARGAALVWCNAREAALGFYLRAGFVATGERFEIAGIGPHFRMHLAL
ncbi:MAG: GNAT family N-acetyltransferase [Deltaproteobacteria bacterium]|nr:GNAT family N-acetyltransferase [Deltaproteobacteria bacterium]